MVFTEAVPLSLKNLTLLKWNDEHGNEQSFRLVDHVSSKWREIGTLLGASPNMVDAWENQGDTVRCWNVVMEHWIAEGGTCDYPATWKNLYTLLIDIKCSVIARNLKKVVDASNTLL